MSDEIWVVIEQARHDENIAAISRQLLGKGRELADAKGGPWPPGAWVGRGSIWPSARSPMVPTRPMLWTMPRWPVHHRWLCGRSGGAGASNTHRR